MNVPGLDSVFLCLGAGVALGCLFLMLKLIRLAGKIGTWGTAFLDLLFCILASLTVFLCALAADHGRFRLYRAPLYLTGAVCTVLALDPAVLRFAGAAEKLRTRIRLSASKVKNRRVPVNREKPTEKNFEKRQKKGGES